MWDDIKYGPRVTLCIIVAKNVAVKAYGLFSSCALSPWSWILTCIILCRVIIGTVAIMNQYSIVTTTEHWSRSHIVQGVDSFSSNRIVEHRSPPKSHMNNVQVAFESVFDRFLRCATVSFVSNNINSTRTLVFSQSRTTRSIPTFNIILHSSQVRDGSALESKFRMVSEEVSRCQVSIEMYESNNFQLTR